MPLLAALGTLTEWLGIAITIVGTALLVAVLRGGQLGPAIGYLREANAVLEQEVETLKVTVKEQAKEIATLRATRDLAPIARRVLDELHGHETRADARFKQTTLILDLIAERLGPDAS
jgi:hypothetical protein